MAIKKPFIDKVGKLEEIAIGDVVDAANLGTGIRDATKFLRDDNTWQSIINYTDAQARQSISLTTNGTTGLSTYDNTTGVLNVPNYTGVVSANSPFYIQNGLTPQIANFNITGIGSILGDGHIGGKLQLGYGLLTESVLASVASIVTGSGDGTATETNNVLIKESTLNSATNGVQKLLIGVTGYNQSPTRQSAYLQAYSAQTSGTFTNLIRINPKGGNVEVGLNTIQSGYGLTVGQYGLAIRASGELANNSLLEKISFIGKNTALSPNNTGYAPTSASINAIYDKPLFSDGAALSFSVGGNNAVDAIERVRISSDGYVGIGTINPQNILEVVSTVKAAKPVPNMTTAQRDAILSPTEGVQIFNITTHEPNYFDGTIWKSGTGISYTDAQARQSISLTTVGITGPSTYNNITGVLNVPDYALQSSRFGKPGEDDNETTTGREFLTNKFFYIGTLGGEFYMNDFESYLNGKGTATELSNPAPKTLPDLTYLAPGSGQMTGAIILGDGVQNIARSSINGKRRSINVLSGRSYIQDISANSGTAINYTRDIVTSVNGNLANTDGNVILNVTSANLPSNVVYTDAIQTVINKTLISPKINVGSDATGDIYYRAASGTFERLGIGTTGQVLTATATIPTWSTPATAPISPLYIQNGTAPQPASNFNISGTGIMAGGTVVGYDATTLPQTASPAGILDIYTPSVTNTSLFVGSGFRLRSNLQQLLTTSPSVLETGFFTIGSTGSASELSYIQSYNPGGSSQILLNNLSLNPNGGTVLIGTKTRDDNTLYAQVVNGDISLRASGVSGNSPMARMVFSGMNVPSGRSAWIGGYYDKTLFSQGAALSFATGATDNTTNAPERMRLTSDGYLGINTTTPTAILDVQSTLIGSKPFPRMTEAQRLVIASPSVGMKVYQLDGLEGEYIYKSTGWNTTNVGNFINNSTTQQVGANFNIDGNGIIGGNSTVNGITTVNGKLNIPAGSNKSAGLATLVGGTVTVSCSIVTVNSIILITTKTLLGTVGTLSYTITPGVSFTVTSTSATDLSIFGYLIIN